MAAVVDKRIDLSKFEHRSQALQEAERLGLGEKEKTDLAIDILKKWGTKWDGLFSIQKTLKLSASSFQQVMSAPGIIINHTKKTPITPDDLLSPEEGLFVLKKYPQAKLFYYINEVGGYTGATLVNIDGKEFIVTSKTDTYVKEYRRLQEKQHRPVLTVLEGDETTVICLTEFLGPETLDFRNETHLALLVNLFPAFSEESDTIDLNRGNIVINNGKLYYIDRDLTHIRQENPKAAVQKNLEFLLDKIKCCGFPDEECQKLQLLVKTQAHFMAKREEAARAGSLAVASAHPLWYQLHSEDEKKA